MDDQRTGELAPVGGMIGHMRYLIDQNREARLREEASGKFRTAPVEPELCQTCKNARHVRRAVGIKHPDFGITFPCPACCRDERTPEEKMRAFGFQWIKSFEQWQPEPNLNPAIKALLDLVRGERWVVMLQGSVGCGKTHLATATAYELVRGGKTAAFWNVPDLLDAIRACYDKGSETAQYTFLHDSIYSRDLIVLDDLGAQKPTAWANAMLYEIVDTLYRGRESKKLIVTTNLGPGEEEAEINGCLITEPRLLSRIMPGNVIIGNAKDRRPEFDR